MDQALFKSAHAAIAFALNYNTTEHVERSPASKMADTVKGSGNGLVGFDGAGQAGFILAELKRTGPLHEACIIARVAKRNVDCSCGAPCCSKHRPNNQWHEAINYIALEVKTLVDAEREKGKRGVVDNVAMRRAIVAKFFGEHIKIKELANACEVSDVTVANHIGKINRILKKNEGQAWEELEAAFQTSGLVGGL